MERGELTPLSTLERGRGEESKFGKKRATKARTDGIEFFRPESY
jgi:hypothetical protein